MNSQVQALIRSRADVEKNAHTFFNYNRFKAEFLFMVRCMRSK